MTRFSLAIPTLRRSDTLASALATLTAQRFDDFEIVVQNNGNDPATRGVVAAANDERIRLHSTDDVLPMTENWERALANCTGDFVTFIGDDDGLLPDACAVAAEMLHGRFEILSWEPGLYFWPSFRDEARRNRLQAPITFECCVRARASRPLLERVYAFEVHYSRLPMIYNSFVARAAVARVRDRYGRYFFGTSPDVTSGIVNAVICDRFLQSSRPLSVAGISRHSNGYRLTQFATAANADDLERDFPLLVSDDPAVSTNLEYAISTDLELVRRELLGGEDLQLDRRGLVRSIASAINNNPARYDQTLALVQRLLTKYELDAELLWIPPRLERPDVLRVGPHMRGAGEVLFVIDGTEAGLSSIADAVRLLSQLVPHCDSIVPSFDVEDEGPPLVSVEPLGFSKGDTGVRALASGWGEPESWGTWTTDRLSTMRLLLPKRRRNARLVLRYRTIPLPNDADRILRCESNGRIVGEWRLSGAKAKGELRIELPTAQPGVPVEVVFINPNSRSPAELGIGRDVRPLGLGVEQIRLMG